MTKRAREHKRAYKYEVLMAWWFNRSYICGDFFNHLNSDRKWHKRTAKRILRQIRLNYKPYYNYLMRELLEMEKEEK